MTQSGRTLRYGLGLCLLLMNAIGNANIIDKRPEQLQGIGVTEHLGSLIKIQELKFRDESGQLHSLSYFFQSSRPVILSLVYFECPRLCTLVLNGMLESLKKFEWTMGDQFEVVTVSIDPRDTPKLAREKKAQYLKAYQRPAAEKGWHFLTGEESQIQALADQIGFRYRYDAADKQYAHSANLFILTPEGKISRYFYGITFFPKDLRFALIDASHGKTGNAIDKILLFCFHFDPEKNSYAFRMWRVVQIILTFQVVALVFFLGFLWKKERRFPSLFSFLRSLRFWRK